MGLIFDDPIEERAFMETDFSNPVSRRFFDGQYRDPVSTNAAESVPADVEHSQTRLTDSTSNLRTYHDEMIARFQDGINYPQQKVTGPSHSFNPSYTGPVWPAQEQNQASRFNPYTNSRRQQQPAENLTSANGDGFNDAPADKRPRLDPLPTAATAEHYSTQLHSLQRDISSPFGQQNYSFPTGFLRSSRPQEGRPSASFTSRAPKGLSPLSRGLSYSIQMQASLLPGFTDPLGAGSTSTTSNTAPSGRADSGVVIPSATALLPATSLTNTLSGPPSATHNDQLMRTRDLSRVNSKNLVFALFNECLRPPFEYSINLSEISTWNPDWTLVGKVTDRTMRNGFVTEELSTMQLQAYGLAVNKKNPKKVGDRLKKQRSRFGKEIYNVGGSWDVNYALRAGPQNDLKADSWDDGQVVFQHAKLSDVYAPTALANWPTGQDRGIMTMCLDWARQHHATYPGRTTRDWNWIVKQLGNQAVGPVAVAPHANLDLEKKAAMNP
ncbi:uncharacterized protein MYCFIDRAFT_81897 [Pseudocercospora fijiensis CIRAD86]|uniref:Uncharacterized protein n=1 Tax=Pseudocercospora fijiensis (strain CIRAD86) TaxID=383855 RepID=M2Z827_PSEFD|nr:uncharacterized protein MYCFIDRAFT_81897 [Pseudocercospora fijiensis CIRAD86]EME85930.1 hypothetical protein MYCFIDRAFT_81897 [Pseudocercospora fijiensis CIRAD86]